MKGEQQPPPGKPDRGNKHSHGRNRRSVVLRSVLDHLGGGGLEAVERVGASLMQGDRCEHLAAPRLVSSTFADGPYSSSFDLNHPQSRLTLGSVMPPDAGSLNLKERQDIVALKC